MQSMRVLYSRQLIKYSAHKSLALSTTAATSAPITMTRRAAVFCTGLGAGTFGSLVGLGGAFVMLPILSGPIGLSAHHAIGTSMAAVLATSMGASYAYGTKTVANQSDIKNTSDKKIFGTIPVEMGDINILASLCIVATSAAFAIVGAKVSKSLKDKVIRRAQGVLMMCVAPTVLARESLKSINEKKVPPSVASVTSDTSHDPHQLDADSFDAWYVSKLSTIGVMSGFLAGLFGVGGGAVVVPSLVLAMDFDYKMALGTSLAVMIPTTVSGATMHFLQGTMLIPYALPLSAGCVIGSYIGAKLTDHIDDLQLKRLFSGTVFVLGLRTFLKAVR